MEIMNILSVKNRRKIIDLFGIMLIFMIGIRGQIFVFNPTSALHPAIPLLLTQDLPDSQLEARLRLPRNGQQDKHEYFVKMEIVKSEDYPKGVLVMQNAIWYPDSMKTADEWNNRKRDYDFSISNPKPIETNSLTIDRPAFALYCSDTDYAFSIIDARSCTYFAYWGHWYTEVKLHSRGGEYLSYSEIQEIIDRVDQLLLAAPDEPRTQYMKEVVQASKPLGVSLKSTRSVA